MGLPVELRKMSVYEIERLQERFDLILFLGVLYHLRHLLFALDLIREHVADDILIWAMPGPRRFGRIIRLRRLGFSRPTGRRALRRRSYTLVDSECRLHAGHAAQRRLPN